jgi:hypothetical protein
VISLSVQAAVSQLQQQAIRTWDLYDLDRLDRALDELVRNPYKATPPAFQRRSAMANASKVLQDRRRIVTFVSIDQTAKTNQSVYSSEPGTDDTEPDVLDIHLWLETTPSLTSLQRDLLRALAAGWDAPSLATRYQVPLPRMRERISRARVVAWAAYQREVQSS